MLLSFHALPILFRNSRLQNPCDSPMAWKQYLERVVPKWKIIEKETVDEILFRTTKPLRPQDLRRHPATYASRSGVPIEIVSKLILWHANLSTTQRYLGTINDVEANRWVENIYG